MGESFGDSKYILVLKDHASHYCELVVADTADSSVTVEALLAWHARLGVPPTWISDQGTHFKNEVVAELSRRLRTQQEFTPAYCPWINGSIERVNRDILQVIRTTILEYKINQTDWPYLMLMLQTSLNHTAVPSLGNKAPVELFTGLPCPTPLREFYLPDAGAAEGGAGDRQGRRVSRRPEGQHPRHTQGRPGQEAEAEAAEKETRAW
ncbi:hypothetical protein PF005_g14331 [Phytophthora fragariae]|uniref:Integrase catalytic domain-containing protein n=1 Tax=Phytophthora fragariae TaxID=53985 RepID=A0A6A3YM56_9STRA|nr:hypothetical protein PF003_g14950 [Phytophthora fragariae]KAE8931855.1 hypothetical protein PF009_g18098 [Phytophthora fragariae]KAE9001673.1 hypothetical protein PF011_g13641 [Phytophthora fragariae]KAE9101969.1 hypothetical protein PF007_g14925 [Phytophthora fragariae]KAE9133732.1 hypothetical protein PF006_g14976 [Phytophthora fragariae]